MDPSVAESAMHLPIEMVRPSPFGPRLLFDPKTVRELAVRIKETGKLDPILVWRDPRHRWRYIILEGEARWRAALRAGLTSVPARIREISEERTAERQTLVACLRQDLLPPLVQAEAYARLLELGLTQRQIAEQVHRSAASVCLTLQLLEFPEYVQRLVDVEVLTADHARVAPVPAVAGYVTSIGAACGRGWVVGGADRAIRDRRSCLGGCGKRPGVRGAAGRMGSGASADRSAALAAPCGAVARV